MTNKYIHNEAYINGEWCTAVSGKVFEVINPATGKIIENVPDLDLVDVRRAVDAAYDAWPDFRDLTGKERSNLLRKWFDLILENKEFLAEIMTLECGKIIEESRGEVEYGASFVEWFSEEAVRIYGDTIPSPSKDKRIMVIKQPVGVVATITPWNFPLAMITRKVAPALAAGCPVIVKPPSETPLTALALSQLADEAGFPAGVYNTVTTTNNARVGKELCENQKIRKISFTGSTAVGKLLMSQCSSTLKKLSLELGGNSPFIVFEDADINEAVKGAMVSKFRNSGQTCVCVNRFFVHDLVYDEFIEKLISTVRDLKVGNGMDDSVQIGPLINKEGKAKVEKLVDNAISEGARLVFSGNEEFGDSLFCNPGILTGVTADMDIAREEIFGPIVTVFRFSSEKEVIERANDTPYGLASYFYSKDIARCWRVAEALECGIVGINEGLVSTTVAPFGGIKESGLGREGSKYGIDDFVEIKYVCIGGIA